MPRLEKYREKIDSIDSKIAALFEQRMDMVGDVARYKIEKGMEVLQPEREQAVIQKVVSKLQNPEYGEALRHLYDGIMYESRKYQQRLIAEKDAAKKQDDRQSSWVLKPKVVYPGVKGSFSEQAAHDFFKEFSQTRFQSEETFERVCVEVFTGKADYGLLPIENSSTGAVGDTYDLLDKYKLYIVGEQVIKVEQYLLGLPGTCIEDIREVYSHPQAISQSMNFLAQYPDWRLIPYVNTANSAEFIEKSGDISKAAIASKRAAQLYGLSVLASNINTSDQNSTRFVIVSAQAVQNADADKASVCLSLFNKVGGLAPIVQCFAEKGIDLSKIESRPVREKPWAYKFYIDMEGELALNNLNAAIAQIREYTTNCTVLGVYKKAVR